VIRALVPPRSVSELRLGETTWAELRERLTWRTALLLVLVLLLPGGMLLLPFVIASARRALPMAKGSLPAALPAASTRTPLPG